MIVWVKMLIFAPTKEYSEKTIREKKEHRTDAYRWLLIPNVQDAYGVPYLYHKN